MTDIATHPCPYCQHESIHTPSAAGNATYTCNRPTCGQVWMDTDEARQQRAVEDEYRKDDELANQLATRTYDVLAEVNKVLEHMRRGELFLHRDGEQLRYGSASLAVASGECRLSLQAEQRRQKRQGRPDPVRHACPRDDCNGAMRPVHGGGVRCDADGCTEWECF